MLLEYTYKTMQYKNIAWCFLVFISLISPIKIIFFPQESNMTSTRFDFLMQQSELLERLVVSEELNQDELYTYYFYIWSIKLLFKKLITVWTLPQSPSLAHYCALHMQ